MLLSGQQNTLCFLLSLSKSKVKMYLWQHKHVIYAKHPNKMFSPDIHIIRHLEVTSLEQCSFEIPSKHYWYILAQLWLLILKG